MFTLDVLFSDHAVFQRETLIPVWGEGEPYSDVEIELNGCRAHTVVSTAGRWLAHLPAMSAGGPYTLTAKNLTSREELRREDVMVGEVWLASGQSNMEFRLDRQRPFEGFKTDFRMFCVPLALNYGAANAIQSAWHRSDEDDAVSPFSAVASYFAERLTERLGVTVGILSSSFGGSDVLSWISRESLLGDRECAAAVRSCDEQISRPGFSPLEDAPENPHLVDYYQAHPLPPEAERGFREKWYAAAFDDAAWPCAVLPGIWGGFTSDDNGAFWFRKTVTLPAAWRGREMQLSIGAADKQDVTFVNGVEIGRMGSGFCEITWNMVRRYTVPAELTQEGILHIAVRVYSFYMDGGLIGKAEDMFLKLGEETVPLAGEWRYQREFSCGRVRHIAADQERKLPFYLLPDNCPGIMFENMIRPLLPYAFRGTIWFQGEHNTEHRREGYRHLMELLVKDWRWHFGMPAMPFHQVSLANFHAPAAFQLESSWAPIRNIQHELGREIGSSAVPAYDCGEADEIHFPDKRPVGRRLAETALCEDYGIGSDCTLEPVRLVRESGNTVVIECRTTARLTAKEGATLFCVSDLERRRFLPCPFTLEGNRIRLEVPSGVKRPCYIRYAWADNPAGAVIYRENGFPLAPFEGAV